jgi:predicted nuclease of predicted toxin-antitoxin system
MRILFDQATPVPLRAYLTHHSVSTASQQGWSALKNGELLTAAEEAGFDVLLTTDRNMRYQQNLAGRKIAVVILSSQQWPELRRHANRVVEVLDSASPGSYLEIELPAARFRADQ